MVPVVVIGLYVLAGAQYTLYKFCFSHLMSFEEVLIVEEIVLELQSQAVSGAEI